MVDIKSPNLMQRILGVMKDLEYIQKGEKTVNGQYRFVSHDMVSAKVHPLLVKHGIVIIPSVSEMTQEGNRTHVKLTVCLVNADIPGDYINVSFPGYGIDPSDKGPGKAISYAYKYALLKTFCLETGDDPDVDATSCFEPKKCEEFESIVPPDGDQDRLAKFLQHCADKGGKHVEEVKREALQRLDSFMAAYTKWKPKTKDKS